MTAVNRAMFANHIFFSNIATSETISKFHKMLDGSVKEEDILSPELWTLMMNQYREYVVYNIT